MLVNGGFQIAPTAAAVFAGLSGLKALVEILERTARFVDWRASHKAQGREGRARWGKRADIKNQLIKTKQGPFWGRLASSIKTALLIDYASNAMTIGPAGSSKTISTVITNIISISSFSKVVPDYKPEILCVTKKVLEARGEKVIALNPFGKNRETIGNGEQINVLEFIVQCLYRPGGLYAIQAFLIELSEQLLQEPNGEKSDDTHWREGAREIIRLISLIQAIIEEFDATLPSVAQIIKSRQDIEYTLRWVVGVDLKGQPLENGPLPIEATPWAQLHDEAELTDFIKSIRSKAGSMLHSMCEADSKEFNSFLSSARQALSPYTFGPLRRSLGRSTFDVNTLKSRKSVTSLFIVLDASNPKLSDSYCGLMQWYILSSLKRHPDLDVPVYFTMDEATNFSVHGLADLLTHGRGFGIRLHLIFQALSAFAARYGDKALETLKSETEIKQFLPGQRSPETLKYISELCASQSVMAASLSAKDENKGLHEQTSETARPLVNEDEIRRMREGILVVRQERPLLTDVVSYAEVNPWRDQADINPHHGKPFKKKVKIKL
jgi:type IV secretion system protein VirD4